MDTSMTAECESLCVLENAKGCCFLSDNAGCSWSPGTEAQRHPLIPNQKQMSVTCSPKGM